MSGTLPKFLNPPVTETVLGVQFKPLAKWQVTHIGLYLARIRTLFPTFATHPPLPDEIENFEEQTKEVRLSFGISNPRTWFTSKDQMWVIQIQNSRFISNWRRDQSLKYPEYKEFKEHFTKEWDRFLAFLKLESIGSPEVEQVEVTYVNHVEYGDSFENWADIFPVWAKKSPGGFLGEPDAVSIKAVFPIETGRGRLYIMAEPVMRHTDMAEIIQLTLTAKVNVNEKSQKMMLESMALAHDWVVKGFADFTTKEMHDLWQRRQ